MVDRIQRRAASQPSRWYDTIWICQKTCGYFTGTKTPFELGAYFGVRSGKPQSYGVETPGVPQVHAIRLVQEWRWYVINKASTLETNTKVTALLITSGREFMNIPWIIHNRFPIMLMQSMIGERPFVSFVLQVWTTWGKKAPVVRHPARIPKIIFNLCGIVGLSRYWLHFGEISCA